MGKTLMGKRGEGQTQGWKEELGAEREGGEGSGRVIFISCALWILMMVLFGVTVGSDYLVRSHSFTHPCACVGGWCARVHA